MSTIAPAEPMTTEELLALPQNGTERWLIRGERREKPMTVRNRYHSRVLIRVGQALENWLDSQPEPRGAVLGGEAGCRLRRDPDTMVGVDVVYIDPVLAAHHPDDTTLIDGVPLLAVEILSPSDTIEEIDEKIASYLEAGVGLVWILDPRDRTVTIYQPGSPPVLVNTTQDLSGAPHLPGFCVPVARLFPW